MDKETSLGKALTLLLAVGESPHLDGISVVDLVATTGFSRPTVYRFLGELQDFGLVRAVPKQPLWQLGPKVIALAALAGNWSILRRRARHAMEDFVRDVGYTVHLAIRDGLEVVYVDKAESSRSLSPASVIGQRRALHLTALGKCLVAFDASPKLIEEVVESGLVGRTPRSITTAKDWRSEIARVRTAGIAYDIEECDPGARCAAAPIFDAQGYAAAAVSVSTIVANPGDVDLEALGARVRILADTIGVPGANGG